MSILPDFIVIGAMKAGTTTLYEHLRHHEEIGMSAAKETDFFVKELNWAKGLAWYHRQFRPGARVYGEASPNYTKAPVFGGVAARMHALVPAAKLIFVARDPVARAASHYAHVSLAGRKVPPPEALVGSDVWVHLIETSSYAAQLAPYRRLFGDEAILVIDFADLVADPAPVLAEVAAHIGVRNAWPGLAHGAVVANGQESLARLPGWIFRLRQSRFGDVLKAGLPPGTRMALKAALRGPKRSAPAFDARLRSLAAEGLAADIADFRAQTGRAFADWPI